MASSEIEDLLSKCPSPETGCLASDPDAVEELMYFDDSVIRADLMSATDAAVTAGIEGKPLEDTTYYPVTLSEIGISSTTVYYDTGAHIGLDVSELELVEGFSGNSIFAEATDDISLLRQRIARCAYACGATALGCPVRTPASDVGRKDYDEGIY